MVRCDRFLENPRLDPSPNVFGTEEDKVNLPKRRLDRHCSDRLFIRSSPPGSPKHG